MEPVREVEKTDKAEFQIFGSVDLTDKGKIKSQYPSWYFDHLKDELTNEISRMETDLKFDRIPKSEVAITQERLFQKKEKMKELDRSCVELRGKQKDRVAGVYEELGEKIREAMFSRSDMKKGLADPREEMKRMTEPTIEVKGDALKLAQACNVRVTKGKVTRDGAAKVWKIIGKALSEHSNVEHLRRD
ncbi:MAG: hypothetical protein WC332_02410 [Clostridia bacterium]|jgi:hypothetical protein